MYDPLFLIAPIRKSSIFVPAIRLHDVYFLRKEGSVGR